MTSGPGMPQGQIVIHITGAMTSAEVRARVDGHPVGLVLPATAVPVPAGRHEVEIEGLQGFVTPFGETRMQVDVAPGRRVDVHYALPRTHLAQGRIGYTSQQRSPKPDWRNIAIGCGGAVVLLSACVVARLLWVYFFG